MCDIRETYLRHNIFLHKPIARTICLKKYHLDVDTRVLCLKKKPNINMSFSCSENVKRLSKYTSAFLV